MNWSAKLKRIAEIILLAVLVLQIIPIYAEGGYLSSASNISLAEGDVCLHQLSASGKQYEVTVTYGDDARIPEGARLQVTEFAEDSQAYLNARNAVQEQMLAQGEAVNENALGLAALNISILDAEGNEIEPAVPVHVDMTIKSLPGVDNLTDIADTLQIQHHLEAENGVVVETVYAGQTEAPFRMDTAEGVVVNPNSVNKQDNERRQIDISFKTPVFSTFTVTWYYGYNQTTIHYGYMNGNNFVEFAEQPSPTSVTTNHHAYLIYDFDGYQYSGKTYYRTSQASNGMNMTSGATSIQARLRYNSGNWQYRSNNNWNNVSNGSHIYVVYDKKPNATQGGTPTVKQSAHVTPPEEPTITKKSTVNGDGTNTLTLSVSGHTADLEVEKLADVIVVFDISGSMSTRDMSNNTRLKAGRDAINELAHVLLNKTNSYGDKLIRMGLVTFSTDARVVQELTDDETVFKEKVDNQTTASGGTNWEKALMLANQMSVDSGRATFVVFVTDGDPTFRISREGETDATLDMYGKNGNDNYYVSDNVFGEGNNDSRKNNYNAAKVEAESIIAHNKTLYTIAISSDASHLDAFADDVGAAGKYTATSTEELSQAFNEIAASIIARMGHSDIQISDGITALTQTVQKSSLVSFAEDDFVYSKERLATQAEISNPSTVPAGAVIENRNGTRYVVWNNWDPTSEHCAKAVYNTATGAVVWNMGEHFMLEDGYTYHVRFKAWPSQAAYDLLADLNNGVKSYASLSEAEKEQISEPTTEGGMYTLKTNSDTSYTYREATKTGDTVTPTGNPSAPQSFPDVDPLELTTEPLKLKKQWHNNYSASREPISSITMNLYSVKADGSVDTDFKEITLTTPDWYAENNYISYGLVTYNSATDRGEKIYETGHDFTLRETDDEAHYYELTAGVFRPMFINGTPTLLERVDEAPAGMGADVFHYNNGTNNYYRLDGRIYRDTASDILLIATNSRRSYMDLNKVVVDELGNTVADDTEFEYKIKFTVPSGIANYDTVEKYIWFSIYDSVARRTLSPEEYTYTGAQKPADVDGDTYGGPAYANYLVATSGQQLTLKIKQGWNVRFLNLPIGTTYSFEETNLLDGYNFVKAEVSGTRWIANMVNGTDQGSAVEMAGLPANASGSNDDTGINGTIDFANARYNTTYTNKTLTAHVEVPVKKILEGRDMKAEEFTFVLQPISIDGRYNDTAIQTITNPQGAPAGDASIFKFALDYTAGNMANPPYHDQAGNAVFYYVVYEKPGDAEDIIYSKDKYIVKVTLKKQGNQLTAEPQYYLYSGNGQLPAEATNDLMLSV